eukprot:TRINITY_DN48621_c0_g1_i1.p1 TRINITY_DN48621_c0_g1~~TRINITY_DN48621_c0_g1_i1.p1  ORF type:complete len:219 (+),score=22.31 TRINITY_DN48621_c0_g1_i1:78-734(+)
MLRPTRNGQARPRNRNQLKHDPNLSATVQSAVQALNNEFRQLQNFSDQTESWAATFEAEKQEHYQQMEQQLQEQYAEKTRQLHAEYQVRNNQLKAREDAVVKREAYLDTKLADCRANFATTHENKVKLNVGGQSFTTTKATLLAEPDTFFFTMVHSGVWQPDADGEYFIDRDPRFVGDIINWLRRGNLKAGFVGLDVDCMSSDDYAILQDQLDFFQVC